MKRKELMSRINLNRNLIAIVIGLCIMFFSGCAGNQPRITSEQSRDIVEKIVTSVGSIAITQQPEAERRIIRTVLVEVRNYLDSWNEDSGELNISDLTQKISSVLPSQYSVYIQAVVNIINTSSGPIRQEIPDDAAVYVSTLKRVVDGVIRSMPTHQ